MKRLCKYYQLLFPLMILFIFIISGCEKENIINRERIGTGCEYFPLKIGNIWNYSRSKAEVKNIIEVNNKEYFEIIVETFAADTVFYSYYEYYRQTPEGKVFMLNNETKKEYLKYDFFIPEKASWTYPESNYNQTWKVTKVSGSKILQINNRKLKIVCSLIMISFKLWTMSIPLF
ncbi:MAG: hypothetical protein HC905_25545 [Bacteroidales bacterium]|nr:hypothetical protein [Bacteroidales bacterium]